MKRQFKGLNDFKRQVKNDKDLQAELQENPAAAIENYTKTSPIDKPWVFAVVGTIIGLVGICCLVFIGLIAMEDSMEVTTKLYENKPINELVPKKIPSILGTIAVSSVTAIVALLAPSPIQNRDE